LAGDPYILKIVVDMNLREDQRTIVIPPQRVPARGLTPGTKVILYEPGDIECEAIVRHGVWWEWVADIVDGTIKRASFEQ
jgi:hypothetical protein